MRMSIRASSILAATLLLGTVPSAHAVNLTGTWAGTMICDLVVAENPHFRSVERDQVVEILMLDNFKFVLEFQDGPTASTPMIGSAVDDGIVETRGKVAAQWCTGNLAVNRFLTADAVVNATTGGGTLTGQLVDLLTSSPGYVQTCRVSFRRTSSAAPVFDSTCP
jgi:hypothetical protein